jgi:hypothetical protein
LACARLLWTRPCVGGIKYICIQKIRLVPPKNVVIQNTCDLFGLFTIKSSIIPRRLGLSQRQSSFRETNKHKNASVSENNKIRNKYILFFHVKVRPMAESYDCRWCQRSFSKPYNLYIHERCHAAGMLKTLQPLYSRKLPSSRYVGNPTTSIFKKDNRQQVR